MPTRAEAFDDLVVDTAQRVRGGGGGGGPWGVFAVEAAPLPDPGRGADAVPLARMWPAQGPMPARIVVYRRPIESIVRGGDLVELVHEVMVEQVALLLGVDPDEVDPDRR